MERVLFSPFVVFRDRTTGNCASKSSILLHMPHGVVLMSEYDASISYGKLVDNVGNEPFANTRRYRRSSARGLLATARRIPACR